MWPEIWHIIGPMLDGVVKEGRATWSEDQFLPLERHGYPEECYFTFSYSPIRDETGGVGGVFCAVTETTGRVIGERRLRLLQELSAEAAAASADEACRRAMTVLARDPADVPFALVYLRHADRATLRLAASTGLEAGTRISPLACDLSSSAADALPWPFRRVLDEGRMAVVESPAAPSTRAFVIPVFASDGSSTAVLVAGISQQLGLDDQYRGFAGLLARQVGGAIAQARALEDERQRAEALAELDRAKTVFFSNVSHEFRTPLTLMLGPTEEALASPARALTGEDLEVVHRNALRLLKLVNTLLDFSRIEAGRAHASFEPTDLAQLTADLASAFRSAMERAGLRFDVDCPPLAAPCTSIATCGRRSCSTCCRTRSSSPSRDPIRLSLRRRGDRVELQVRDTGIGIPEDELPHLFERFHRVHGARARTHEGSGIGLALVHELVKLHGGTLSVGSTVGKGTTFTVSMPAGTRTSRRR